MNDLLAEFCVMKVCDLFKYEGDLDKLGDFLVIVTFMPLYVFFFYPSINLILIVCVARITHFSLVEKKVFMAQAKAHKGETQSVH